MLLVKGPHIDIELLLEDGRVHSLLHELLELVLTEPGQGFHRLCGDKVIRGTFSYAMGLLAAGLAGMLRRSGGVGDLFARFCQSLLIFRRN